MQNLLSWVEISRGSLQANIKQFKGKIAGDDGNTTGGSKSCILCPCVKANAYGHCLVATSKIFLEAGASWLSVNALYEAVTLREAGVTAPIYVMGYTLTEDLKKAWELDLRLVVYEKSTISKLGEISKEFDRPINLHIKVETGNNRQGVHLEDLVEFAKYIKSFERLNIEGLATHFANIEDTTDHSYAFAQVEKFRRAKEVLGNAGIPIPMMHCANSAATILYPELHFDMVRVGISAYGMWPSTETFVSYKNSHLGGFDLKPAFSFKSVVGQVKSVGKNEYIGYGCTCRLSRDTKMAVVPVGYYDGYDRRLSNNAHVLIHGQRAKILGRVCMNMIMADITDIPGVNVEDEVVLIGSQEYDGTKDTISAEQVAEWATTINYEVVTRINERIPRVVVD